MAKSWKSRNGGVIVDGASPELKDILKNLEGNMSGGKIVAGARGLSRQNSLLIEPGQDADMSNARLGLRPAQASLAREDSQQSFGMSSLGVEEEEDDENIKDPRKWFNVIDAYDQPRYSYNVAKKHFERYEINFALGRNLLANDEQGNLKTVTTTASITQDCAVQKQVQCHTPKITQE